MKSKRYNSVRIVSSFEIQMVFYGFFHVSISLVRLFSCILSPLIIQLIYIVLCRPDNAPVHLGPIWSKNVKLHSLSDIYFLL